MKLLRNLVLLLVSIVVLSACGENVKDEDASNGTPTTDTTTPAEENENKDEEASATPKESSDIQIQFLDRVDIETGNFDVVEFEHAVSPSNNYFSFASNGLLAFEYEGKTYYDYLTGKPASDIESSEDSILRYIDLGELLYYTSQVNNVYDGKYYVTSSIGDPFQSNERRLFEFDMEARKLNEVLEEDFFSVLTKEDDILYIGTKERMYAYDLATEEILWETDTTVQEGGFTEFFVTENSLMLYRTNYLAVFSKEDGELLYEEEIGSFYAVTADEDKFYVLANVGEDFGEEQIQIFEYHETDGLQQELIEPVRVERPYEEINVSMEIINGRFLINLENAVLAFDASTYERLWTVSAGSIEDWRDTGDDYSSYEMRAVFGDKYIYTFTESALGYEDDINLFSIIDAATGEVLENYLVGNGTGIGPYLDEATGKVLFYYVDNYSDDRKSYVYMMDVE